MDREQYIAGLKEVIAFYENNPDIPTPSYYSHTNATVGTKEDAAAVMRALGACKKEYEDNLFTVAGMIGKIDARFVFFRDAVCVKRVVGTKVEPAKIIERQVLPERTVEIVEWDCMPILSTEEPA